MSHPNPMVDLCALLAHGELTLAIFSEWSARHYGPVLGSSQVTVLLEDFDAFLAQLSSTELSRSLRKLRPLISKLAHTVQESAEGATTDRRDELQAAMRAPSSPDGATKAILAWISRHHGDPRSIEPTKVGAILGDFDEVLTTAEGGETEFTRAILRLRGVFARRAESAPTSTVTFRDAPKAEASAPEDRKQKWVRSDGITFTSG